MCSFSALLPQLSGQTLQEKLKEPAKTECLWQALVTKVNAMPLLRLWVSKPVSLLLWATGAPPTTQISSKHTEHPATPRSLEHSESYLGVSVVLRFPWGTEPTEPNIATASRTAVGTYLQELLLAII